ncbi:MAG: hypothetical protein ABIS50_03160 [Luteolibacter sp.]|uniref:LBF_2804 family protein n=1 Tax=Luteolibacter sp. TaxID=1962973 RepID=UPI0032649321
MNEPTTALPSRFERFGLYHLERFERENTGETAFEIPDEELTRQVNRISVKGVVLSCLVGMICVFPIIYVDVRFTNASAWVHYGWLIAVTVVATAIEFYCLFYISLKAVHKVSELIHLEHVMHESLEDGIFGVKNILARTALEINDPELKILGIDPFKRISKKNLFVLGLLYKGKIIVSNLLLKYSLRFTVGSRLLGVPILYAAIPVEMFWNGLVILKVIREARLRLFGYALANKIADSVAADGYLEILSPEAKKGCLRAIGNAVVMTQNYHPNMIILLLRFKDLFQVEEEDRYDDWELFLETLREVSEQERNFLLDLLTVAAAFDGKLSPIEKEHLQEAYQQDAELYLKRLTDLTSHLKNGRLNAALSLCQLDFIKG